MAALLLLLLYNRKNQDRDYDEIMRAVLIRTKWEGPLIFLAPHFDGSHPCCN